MIGNITSSEVDVIVQRRKKELLKLLQLRAQLETDDIMEICRQLGEKPSEIKRSLMSDPEVYKFQMEAIRFEDFINE